MSIESMLDLYGQQLDEGRELLPETAQMLFGWSESHGDLAERIDGLLARHQRLVEAPLTRDQRRVYLQQSALSRANGAELDPSLLRNLARSAVPSPEPLAEDDAEPVDHGDDHDQAQEHDR